MKRAKKIHIRKKAAILKIHAQLKFAHPVLFEKPYKPFAIGIHDQILDSHPNIDVRVLRVHLKNITHHPLYLKNFIDSDVLNRLNLDGSIAEALQNDERLYARDELLRIMGVMEKKYRRKLGDDVVDGILAVLGKV